MNHVVMNFSFSGWPRNPWVTTTRLDVSFFTTVNYGTDEQGTFSSSCIQVISRLEFRESVPTWPSGPLAPADGIAFQAQIGQNFGPPGLARNPMYESVFTRAMAARRNP